MPILIELWIIAGAGAVLSLLLYIGPKWEWSKLKFWKKLPEKRRKK